MVIIDGRIEIRKSSPQKKPLELFVESKKLTTSDSFRVKNKSIKWTHEETEKFYQVRVSCFS
jgi:hypothetical protein